MASQNSSALPAFPVPPASAGSERHVEPVLRAFLSLSFAQMSAADPSQVLLDVSTIEEIIESIVNARQDASESVLSFHWQPSQVDDLSEQLDARLVELDEPKIRRFEYDYESETAYLDIMKESPFHYQVQAGLRDYLKDCLAKLLVATDDTEIRQLIRSAKEQGTASIEYENKLCKQADVSFGQAGTLPSLVCEVS